MNVQASIVHEAVGEPRRHALRVEDFLVLQESGVFDSFARAELIDGEIYTVNAIYRPHAGALSQVNAELVFALRALGLPLTVYSPVSARLDDNSMPEPDLVIATTEPEDAVSARSIRLAVEVASSSLVYDLGKKGPLYAAAGIPEYWIVDLTGRKIIRMSDCVDGRYRRIDEIAFGQTIASVTIENLAIPTSSLA